MSAGSSGAHGTDALATWTPNVCRHTRTSWGLRVPTRRTTTPWMYGRRRKLPRDHGTLTRRCREPSHLMTQREQRPRDERPPAERTGTQAGDPTQGDGSQSAALTATATEIQETGSQYNAMKATTRPSTKRIHEEAQTERDSVTGDNEQPPAKMTSPCRSSVSAPEPNLVSDRKAPTGH